MESWKENHTSIYSTNSAIQLELLNQSTADWGLGFLPANVIVGSSNDSARYDNETLVIWNAGESPKAGGIFIAVSVLSVVLTFIWAGFNWDTLLAFKKHDPPAPKPQALLRQPTGSDPTRISRFGRPMPLNSVHPAVHATTLSSTAATSVGTELGTVRRPGYADMDAISTSMEMFGRMIKFYYEAVDTELEEYEKLYGEARDNTDIEAAVELMRRHLALGSEIWSHRNTQDFPEARREAIKRNSELVLKTVRDEVTSWEGCRDWDKAEEAELRAIMVTLNLREPAPAVGRASSVATDEEVETLNSENGVRPRTVRPHRYPYY